jgi:uncharacterized protein (DUF1499 family)
MRYVIRIASGLAIFILISLIGLSVYSRYKQNSGLVNGKLAPCPETSNCVCTEDYANQNYQPLPTTKAGMHADWNILLAAIKSAGGEIQNENDTYVWATFVTPFWRFVDDFEARLDTSQAMIHLRSASRVGSYDYGTNLKRVNRIVDIYQKRNISQMRLSVFARL